MLSPLLGFTLCLNAICVLLLCEIFCRTHKRRYVNGVYVEMCLNKLFVNISIFYMKKMSNLYL